MKPRSNLRAILALIGAVVASISLYAALTAVVGAEAPGREGAAPASAILHPGD